MLARGIHASRAPEVRAKIVAGVLHRMPCAACGTTLDIHHDMVFTDFKRGDWVRVARPGALTEWQPHERETLEQFERLMTMGAPIVADLAPTFRVRLVFDLDELRERLVIWDAGLDDAIVECVKLGCLRERADLVRPGHRVRLRSVEVNGDLDIASVPGGTPSVDAMRWTVPAGVVQRVHEARSDWQAQVPELFGRGFVSVDRYL